jgi:hypothetical protein
LRHADEDDDEDDNDEDNDKGQNQADDKTPDAARRNKIGISKNKHEKNSVLEGFKGTKLDESRERWAGQPGA